MPGSLRGPGLPPTRLGRVDLTIPTDGRRSEDAIAVVDQMDMHPHRVILALRSATISDGLTGHFLMRAEAARTDFRGVQSMRRILFVDDHPIYRDGVRRVLESSGPDVQVLTADGASSALKLLREWGLLRRIWA